MIEIDGLKFQYTGANFCLAIEKLGIERGRKVAFVGPSGCGKTTLLHLIAGILQPSAGQIEIDRLSISGRSDSDRRRYRARNIGFVFQDFRLVDYLNVQHNILLPYRINSHLKLNADIFDRADRLAKSVGIYDQLAKPIDQLSHGERQRLAICRALIANPKLVLADEPTGNLDPNSKRNVLDVLIEQTARSNATLIVVTHDTSLLSSFDQVIDVGEFRMSSTSQDSEASS